MSPKGTLVCCDKWFVAWGGDDVPQRGAWQSAILPCRSPAVKTLRRLPSQAIGEAN